MTTRITTSFTANSTAHDVVAGVDLRGRRAIVTGGASGIGVETARALVGRGADVTLAVRDVVAGRRIADDIADSSVGNEVHVARLDLADQASVAMFVSEWVGPLHILINNAGVMGLPLNRTRHGWELHFATNHLGHMALATGLHSALAEEGARVVAVSSSQHRLSPVVFDDIHYDHRPYDANLAYAQSKTANALFAVEAAKRWADDGITANSVMPGVIRTNLMRHADPEEMARAQASGLLDRIPWKTAQQGAATSVLVAASPLLTGVTGRYFEDCSEAEGLRPDNPHGGVAEYAVDHENASRLWDYSIEALAAAR